MTKITQLHFEEESKMSEPTCGQKNTRVRRLFVFTFMLVLTQSSFVCMPYKSVHRWWVWDFIQVAFKLATQLGTSEDGKKPRAN